MYFDQMILDALNQWLTCAVIKVVVEAILLLSQASFNVL